MRSRLVPRAAAVAAALLVATGAAGAGLPAAAQEEQQDEGSAQKAAALVAPSLVAIEAQWSAFVEDHEGDVLNDGSAFEFTTTCSGFVVAPDGFIVTAGHCVDPGLDGAGGVAIGFGVDEWITNGYGGITEEGRADLTDLAFATWDVEGADADSPPDRTVRVRLSQGSRQQDFIGARVVDVEPLDEGDVALLKVQERNLPAAPVGREDPGVGTEIVSAGFPSEGGEVVDTSSPRFRQGRISSRATREQGSLPVLEVSAAVAEGMSGGPTFDLNGNVVGVNSFALEGGERAPNFVSPASLMVELLSSNGVNLDNPGPVNAAYREAVNAFFEQDFGEARDKFDEVLEINPDFEQARDLRADAAANADDGGSFPIAIVAAALGVLVVGGAATAFALRRRKQQQEAAAAAYYYDQQGYGYDQGYQQQGYGYEQQGGYQPGYHYSDGSEYRLDDPIPHTTPGPEDEYGATPPPPPPPAEDAPPPPPPEAPPGDEAWRQTRHEPDT